MTSSSPAPLPVIPTPPPVEQAHEDLRRQQLHQLLADRLWRLSNLYWIKPEGGGDPAPFRPRPPQVKVYKHLIETPKKPLYIVKSRRIGFSTALSIFSADQTVFTAAQTINLVDFTQPDAHKKMRDLFRYAIDMLPPEILSRLDFPARNEGHFSVKVKGQPDSALSNFYAGMNARGGDSSGLWVSEWGPLSGTPEGRIRSSKIRAGAFPAARNGWRCVETTWMGGKMGDLWELIKPIYEGNPNADGTIMFFPWHEDPFCVDVTGEVTPDVEDYFRKLGEELGKDFSPEQKKWWAKTALQQGIHMPQEFPSSLEEALSAPGAAPKFNIGALNWMEKQTSGTRTFYGALHMRDETSKAIWEPMSEQEPTAWLRVWEHPQPGLAYILASDFCTGRQDVERPDYHAGVVIRMPYQDAMTGAIVPAATAAAIRPDQRTDLDVYAAQLAAMSRFYGECLLAPELNNLYGIITILRSKGCTNIFERALHPDSKEDKKLKREPGWLTTSASKPIICEYLATAIREHSLIVHCPRMLSELRAFQINLEALTGHHDDWVMALAIAMYTGRHATPMVHRMPLATRITDHPGMDSAGFLAPDAVDRSGMFVLPGGSSQDFLG